MRSTTRCRNFLGTDMSLTVELVIWCDVLRCGRCFSAGAVTTDDPAGRLAAVRAEAAKAGWTRRETPSGTKDICPACAQKVKP